MDKVMTGVTDDAEVVVVIGTPRITPRNDVMDVQGGRIIIATDFACFFWQPLLFPVSS
jgi:hypothetical protein